MKNALAWAAVLCLAGSAAVADTFPGDPNQFATTKDNSVLGHALEIYQNTGASGRNRIAKSYQHQMILDFDTDAMKAFQTANPLGVGEYYRYELFLHVRGDWEAAPKAVQIRTLNVDDDWAEGDATWLPPADFDWSAGTAASIYEYAQGFYTDVDGLPGTGDEVLDTVNSIPWKDETGVAATNLLLLPYSYQNAVDFTASVADHGFYVGVVLDDDTDPRNTNFLVNDLLNNPKNRGLRTWKDDYDNERVDFRDQDGGIYAPYIDVTVGRAPVTVGPEGGYGRFGIREVINNGDIGNVNAAVSSLLSGTGTIVDYAAPVINISDPGGASPGRLTRMPFRNDRNFRVVDGRYEARGSVDGLAMVARANIVIPTAGAWTFCVNSDDGFELAIDGVPIAEVSGTKSVSAVFGTADLAAGVHSLQLLYFENYAGSAVELSAAQGVKADLDGDFRLIGHKSGPDAVIPGIKGDITVVTTVPRAHGVIDSLADARAALAADSTPPVTDTTINYDDPHDGAGPGAWNDGSRRFAGDRPFPNDTLGNDDQFALRAEGTLLIPVDGVYHLGYRSDDGGSLQLVGQMWDRIVADASGRAVINGDAIETDLPTSHAYTVGEITLTAGEYDFELLYFERGGGAWVELFGGSADAVVYELLTTGPARTIADFDGLQLVPEPATILIMTAAGLPMLLKRRRHA